MVGEVAVAVRVERPVDSREQRGGRAHEGAVLQLEHLDRQSEACGATPCSSGRAAVPDDDAGHRRRVRGGGRGRGRVLRLAADRVPARRDLLQVGMRPVDRPVEQRDRDALAVAAAGRERPRCLLIDFRCAATTSAG